MKKIRTYHAALAILTSLAWLSGDFGAIHDWLGYAVGVIILFRILWGFFNPRQLGLNQFYPQFKGMTAENAMRHPAVSRTLILGVALTVAGATGTGVMLVFGIGGHEVMEKLHEAVSNLVFLFVALHAFYLLVFRTPLAKFMLYRDTGR
jgi:cytochrome b